MWVASKKGLVLSGLRLAVCGGGGLDLLEACWTVLTSTVGSVGAVLGWGRSGGGKCRQRLNVDSDFCPCGPGPLRGRRREAPVRRTLFHGSLIGRRPGRSVHAAFKLLRGICQGTCTGKKPEYWVRPKLWVAWKRTMLGLRLALSMSL